MLASLNVVADPASSLARALVVAMRGGGQLALSGESPHVYDALAVAPLPWPRVHVWQMWERVAPEFSGARRFTTLFARLPVPAAFQAIPVSAADRSGEQAATRFAEALAAPPARGVLDAVELRLGADGSLGVLVPGSPLLKERRLCAAGADAQGAFVTLTLPALARARSIHVLAEGPAVRGALAGLLKGDLAIPAGRLRHPHLVVYADSAAAG